MKEKRLAGRIPSPPSYATYEEQLVGKPWTHLVAQRESAPALRGAKLKERLYKRTKALMDLNVSHYVVIQNQTRNAHPFKDINRKIRNTKFSYICGFKKGSSSNRSNTGDV